MFLGIVDRTGLGATGLDVAEEFEEIIKELEERVFRNLQRHDGILQATCR